VQTDLIRTTPTPRRSRPRGRAPGPLRSRTLEQDTPVYDPSVTRLPDIGFRPTVPVLLRAAAKRYHDDDYIVMTDRRLSFEDAERRSGVLAKRLLAWGAGKGTRIGIVLPSSTQFVVAFLAAARIGAIATLFSSTYRPAELGRAMRLADVQLLLAPRTLLGRDYEPHLEETVVGLASTSPPFGLPSMPYLRRIVVDGGSTRAWVTPVSIDDRTSVVTSSSDPIDGITDDLLQAVESEVSPADPLLMIWTSGSSADPKGVVHTHGVAVRKVSPQVGLFRLNSSTPDSSTPGRAFMAMPLFWVGGPQNLLGCLFSGSALICQERFEPDEALELIERERCTTVAASSVAGSVDRLRSHPEWARHDTSSLNLARVAKLSSRGHPTNFGMTETFGPHANRDLFDYKVVDPATGSPIPDGQEGEFCVRGFALMAAMYKREREEVLDADGYYHTGDRGYLEKGDIYFTGRYSELIKSAGANVSPLEVEGVLQAIPEVKLALVFGVPSQERGEEVVAVLVPENGKTIDSSAVLQQCRSVLSAYKVPTRIYLKAIEEIPVLASGKPDKRSVRAAVADSTPLRR